MSETRNAGRGPGARDTAHPCPAGGCRAKVRADRLMCAPHWYQVPKPLRDAVWATWRSGEGALSPAHRAACDAAIAAVDRQRQEAAR